MKPTPYIPGTSNSMRDVPDYKSADTRNTARCPNPRHAAPAGWCSTCDQEWDYSDMMTDQQFVEAQNAELVQAKQDLAEAEAELQRLLKRDPRDVVRVVEARKRRNDCQEKIEHMGGTV